MTDEETPVEGGASGTGRRKGLFRRHRVITVVAACAVAAGIGVPVAMAATAPHPGTSSASWSSFNTQGDQISAWVNANSNYDSDDITATCTFLQGAEPQLDGWKSPDATLNQDVNDFHNELVSTIADGCGATLNYQGLLSDAAAVTTTSAQIQARLAIVDPQATWAFSTTDD